MSYTTIQVSHEIRPLNLSPNGEVLCVGVVHEAIQAVFREIGVFDHIDYFHVAHGIQKDASFSSAMEDMRWIACYTVAGSNEGDYFHVDLVRQSTISGGRKTVNVFTGKTFNGKSFACDLVKILSVLLDT